MQEHLFLCGLSPAQRGFYDDGKRLQINGADENVVLKIEEIRRKYVTTVPDVLTDLQDRTQLTRKSLVRILTECGRLNDFKRNPQAFIEIAGEVINRTKRLALVDGIKYQKIGDDSYYAQELFQQEELLGYLKNMLKDQRQKFGRCVAEKMLIYALGRGLESYDDRAVDRIVDSLGKNQWKFSALVAAIAKSEPFVLRRGKNQQ